MKKIDDKRFWPNQDRDLKLAASILKKHAINSNECVLFQGRLKSTEEGAQASLIMPSWLQELAAVLKAEYGKHHFIYVLDDILLQILVPLRQAEKITTTQLRIFRNFAFFFFCEDDRSSGIH